MRKGIALSMLLLPAAVQGADGELGWRSLSFCDAGDYCISLETSPSGGLGSLSIEHSGTPIPVPSEILTKVHDPLLNHVRLVDILKYDHVSEKRLEIP
jgi:hypothetical protein